MSKIFSEEDHQFFEENGYVIVEEAVPPENTRAVVQAIFEFLGFDQDEPEGWYREPHRTGGMVEIYHHQSMWNNRQHPRVHQAFSEIWGTEKLWCSMDRVCLKPPRHSDHPEYDHKGFLHWDAQVTELPLTFGVQGVVALTDTAENQGGFQCVPGAHNRLAEYERENGGPLDRSWPNDSSLKGQPIPMKEGDLLIWHYGLIHGNGHNVSDRPRLSQYISMSPAKDEEEDRQSRVAQWRQKTPPNAPAFPGDPRSVEQKTPPAELTELGKKLLGLEVW